MNLIPSRVDYMIEIAFRSTRSIATAASHAPKRRWLSQLAFLGSVPPSVLDVELYPRQDLPRNFDRFELAGINDVTIPGNYRYLV